jgi:hypothetical protein
MKKESITANYSLELQMPRVLCFMFSRNSRKYESSPVNARKPKRLNGIGVLVLLVPIAAGAGI